MGIGFFSSVLCASLCLTSSLSLAQSATATPSTAPLSGETAIAEAPDSTETSWLVAQWLVAIGLLGGAIAISFGVYRYNRNERWYRIEFLRKTVKEFEQDPEIWKALKTLDF